MYLTHFGFTHRWTPPFVKRSVDEGKRRRLQP